MSATVTRLVGVYDADGTVPVVVAGLGDGSHVVLLGPEDLAACAASPERLVERVEETMGQQGLTW